MSTTVRVSAIAAIDLGYGIGHRGTIPWKLPADLRRFRSITLGHPVVMGRATYDSIGRPLAGRANIVLTRDPGYARDGVTVARSLDEAMALARAAETSPEPETMILGGAAVFTLALPRCTRIHLSVVANRYPADAYFPRDWGDGWTAVRSEAVPADGSNTDAHLFVLFERAQPTDDYSGPSPVPVPQ